MMQSLVLNGGPLRILSYLFFAVAVVYAGYLLFATLKGRRPTTGGTEWEQWSLQMDEAEGYPEGHGQRVAEYAVAIGERYGLDPATLSDLEHAALLHDVGELEMGFLAQPGALTPGEITQLWEHPIIGERLLTESDFAEAGAIVRHHHERWDGTGYPDRLRGEAIPLPARILSVADTFEAFQFDRPYRPAMDADTALDEIKRRAGTLFDPQVVQVFVAIQESLVPMPATAEF